VEAAAAVGAMLIEGKPDEALKARQQDAALLEEVLVVERDVAKAALATPAVDRATRALALGTSPGAPGAAAYCCRRHGLSFSSPARLWASHLTNDGTWNATKLRATALFLKGFRAERRALEGNDDRV
jgi:hypothetical protein